MASLLAKSICRLARTSLLPRVCTTTRFYSDKTIPYYDPSEGKEASKDISMPDELGGAIGIERWELIQQAKGIEDPFLLGGMKMTHGTKDDPTIVRTVAASRTIGCICEEDSTTVRYIELFPGETRRCQCGHFFKLVPVED